MKALSLNLSKFSIPDIPLKSLFSGRIESLGVDKNRLSILTAPAGFGKTTAVLLSLREHRNHTKWYRLSKEDALLHVWYSHLISVLFSSHASEPDDVLADSIHMLAGITNLEENYPLLNAQIVQDAYTFCEGEDEKYYLVLDDFQYAVDNPIIIETLQYFVENMPPCLSIVITSRRDPGIMEGRLALREDVRLVNSEELLFTLEEARLLVKNVYNLALSDAHIETIFRRTDGWIAGLYILCREGDFSDEDVASIDMGKMGEDLLSLFLSRYLREITGDRREDLIRLSVLDDFSCEEIETLLKVKEPEQFIQWLESGSFYIQKMTTMPVRYRFHSLLREELLKLFQITFDEEERKRFLRKLGEYYREADPRLSVRYFLQGGMEDLGLQVARENGQELFDQGSPEKMFLLLDEFPENLINTDPYLLLFKGMANVNMDRESCIEIFMTAIDGFKKRKDYSFLMNTFGMILVNVYQSNNFVTLEKAYRKLPIPSLVLAGGEVFRKLQISFFIAFVGQDEIKRAKHLRRILDRKEIDSEMWAFSYYMIRGISYYRSGDLDAAYEDLKRVTSHKVWHRNDQWRIIALVSCCNVSILRMDLKLLQSFADEFFLLGEKYDSIFATGYGYFMLAYVNFRKCDVAGAIEALDANISLFTQYGSDVLVKESQIVRFLWKEDAYDEATIEEAENIYKSLLEEKPGHGMTELAMVALGALYKRANKFEEAYQVLKESLALVEKKGIKQSVCGILLQLSDLFYRQGEMEIAKEYAGRFAEVSRRNGYIYWREADLESVETVWGMLEEDLGHDAWHRELAERYQCNKKNLREKEAQRKTCVRVKFFGDFQISVGEITLSEKDFKTKKVSGILKYILSLDEGNGASREKLASLFWPDASSKAASASLRVALYELRKILAAGGLGFESESALLTERKEGFYVSDHVELDKDTDNFESKYQICQTLPTGKEEDMKRLEEICQIYDGDFLGGQHYDDWAEVLREHYSSLFYEALSRLASIYISNAQYEQAERLLLRGLKLEPFNEKCCSMLVDVYRKSGQESRGEHFLQVFTQRYNSEMGIDFDEEE